MFDEMAQRRPLIGIDVAQRSGLNMRFGGKVSLFADIGRDIDDLKPNLCCRGAT